MKGGKARWKEGQEDCKPKDRKKGRKEGRQKERTNMSARAAQLSAK